VFGNWQLGWRDYRVVEQFDDNLAVSTQYTGVRDRQIEGQAVRTAGIYRACVTSRIKVGAECR